MIILVTAILFALWGGSLARRREGGWADIAQYAAVYGLIGAVVGLFGSIALMRMV